MNTYEEDLALAKLAYKSIKLTMQDFRNAHPHVDIMFCWDECLWVNEHFFQIRELEKESSDK